MTDTEKLELTQRISKLETALNECLRLFEQDIPEVERIVKAALVQS